MDSTLIAKILAPTLTNTNAIGTGYPISKDLVITARHVVDFDTRDISKPIEIVWTDITISENTSQSYSVKVKQEHIAFFDGYDVALIKCQAPPQAHISPLILSERHPIDAERWKSMGYAKVGKHYEMRNKVAAMGEIFPPDICCAILDLESKGDAKEKVGWKGISGAPVFRGHTLIAVLIETPENMNERLKAVSIPYLLKHVPEFREMTGVGLHSCDFTAATKALQTNIGAKTALFNQLNHNYSVTDSPSAIIAYLSTIPIPELITIVNTARENHSDREVYKTLTRLLCEMLPLLYDPACTATIRSCKSDRFQGIIEIPYATEVSAEMLMASVDNRPAEFRFVPIDVHNPVRRQAIPSSYKLSLPPESGASSNTQYEDISDDLFNRLLGIEKIDDIASAVDDHLFRKIARKQRGRSYSPEEKQKMTKSELERDAKNRRPGYYWIWNISDTENQNYKDSFNLLARKIKENYPAITLLSLDFRNINQEIEENELFDSLHHTKFD